MSQSRLEKQAFQDGKIATIVATLYSNYKSQSRLEKQAFQEAKEIWNPILDLKREGRNPA